MDASALIISGDMIAKITGPYASTLGIVGIHVSPTTQKEKKRTSYLVRLILN